MKKYTFGILSIFICLFIFGACLTNGELLVFDESLSADEIAVINFYSGRVSIVEYNGIAVNWDPFPSGLEIRIPGGSTQFILNGTTGSYNAGYTVYRNMPFTYNFEKGREYTFFFNQHIIMIFNGKSISEKDLLASFNMRNGQTQTN